jgi:hypothetical protein
VGKKSGSDIALAKRRDGESYYLSSGTLCGKRIFESVENAECIGSRKTQALQAEVRNYLPPLAADSAGSDW